MLGLRVYAALPQDERSWRNDERELHQRDRAHFLAYQAVGMAVVVQAFVATVRMVAPRVQAWMTMPPDQLYYGIAVVTITLFLTLPQAILLWTEPDMEEDRGQVRGQCMDRGTKGWRDSRARDL